YYQEEFAIRRTLISCLDWCDILRIWDVDALL
ncbi:unnamed protein product, partial [marine sediment metagenome]